MRKRLLQVLGVGAVILAVIGLLKMAPAGSASPSPTLKTAQVVWQTNGLAAGVQHKVTVTVTGTHNPAAAPTSTNEVDVDAFIALR